MMRAALFVGFVETTGYGMDDIFIVKFDSVGAFQWARRLGGTAEDESASAACDSTGNIVVTGHVRGNADLNGDGDRSDTAESAVGYGELDIFIVKFNTDGTCQWAKRLGGTDYDYGKSVACFADTAIFVTGAVKSNADLNGDGDSTDGGAESAAGNYNQDIFVVKIDAAGTVQ